MENDNSASSEVQQNDYVSADYRKLFVGGLHRETGEQDIRDYFGKYGEIQYVDIKTDPATGTSRGFAFVVFKSVEALSKVEAVVDHVINGKKVDPKKARTRQGKIFVGGLSLDLTDEDIKTHFAQFGKIVETHMPFDKIKNQRKRFCFIVFEAEGVVKYLLKNPIQNIKGKEVEVKRDESNPEHQGGPMMGGSGGHGSMRGGGGYEMEGFNEDDYEQTYNYYESTPYQRVGSIMRGRGGRGGIRDARGGLQDVHGFNQGNGQHFESQGIANEGNYEQAYNYHESDPYQRGGSMVRGRGGNRGSIRGARGGLRDVRGFDQGFESQGIGSQGNYEQAYNYHELKPDQRGGSMMRGRGGIRSVRDGLQNDQSYNLHDSKPEQPGGSMMGGRRGRGGFRGARDGGEGYGLRGTINKGNYEQAYNNRESKPDQRGGSVMRGRGGRGGIRGARSGIQDGYGVQGSNQGNGQGYEQAGGAAYRGGYGQRYQPY